MTDRNGTRGRVIRQALCMAVLGGFVATASADCEVTMQGKLAVDAPVAFDFAPKAALAPWQMMDVTGGFDANPDGSRNFACLADARRIDGRVRVAEPKPGVVTCEWTFRPKTDLKLIVLGLMTDLKIADYGGGQLTVDGETMPVQRLDEIRDIRRKGLKRLSLADAQGGKRLDWAFREPVDLHVQYWGGETLSFRILLPADDGGHAYAAGRKRALTFSLKGAGRLRESRLNPVTIRAGKDWIPFSAAGEIVEGSALDLSAIRPTGKPAGRHGRVVARGAHFEFENLPGVPQRFYGVNLCGTANYPETLADARRLAQNLARIGYNTVRIHHHDALCVDRTKPGRTELDEAMMRRMDNLFKACAEEGLYITTDLFVSRTGAGIAWRDIGVDRDGSLSMEDYKYTVPVHEGAYSNFLAFARNFLGHVNVHTGVRYAEDPTLAWISLVNEGNIEKPGAVGYASHPGWKEAWAAWLAQKRQEDPSTYAGLSDAIPNRKTGSKDGAAFTLFLRDVETRLARRTAAALRAWGCKALITDMNDCTGVMVGMTPVRGEVFDYLDTHFYVDHPRFFERPWARPSYCPNANPLKGEALGAAKVTTLRVLDRPFTVSEYNFSGPGRYRGVGGILTGVEAALQDWASLWRFGWSHRIETALRPGSEGVGYFDIACDPLQLASERASICLFLRGDLKPLRRTFAVTVPPEKARDLSMPVAASALFGWQWVGWYAKTGFLNAPSAPSGTDWSVGFDAAAKMTAGDVRRLLFGADALPATAGDGAVRVDGTRGSFSVEMPLTAGGFAESGTVDAGTVRATLGGAPATVWASSLDGRPIRASGRLLVTHLTDVQNTGTRYADEDMKILRDFGSLPYLMRRGTAEVSVARAAGAPSCRVYALDATGARRGEVPSRLANGRLVFLADVARDPRQATCLYEIEGVGKGLGAAQAENAPVVPKVVFDTDMVEDYDDVGALACLHALADEGRCEILAMATCTRGNQSVAAVEILNAFYGQSGIPVGCAKGLGVVGVPGGDPARRGHEKYVRLAKDYPLWVKHLDSDDAPDANDVYRRALAAAPDKSVVFCSVGFLTNLRRLLETGPDAASPLGGRELVARKVRALYAMAGAYPQGREYNVLHDAESAKVVFMQWPTEIYVADFHLGRDVYSGRGVAERTYAYPNPVHDVFARCLPSRAATHRPGAWDREEGGHSSWDELTVLAAVTGAETHFKVARGGLVVSDDGSNIWSETANAGGALRLDEARGFTRRRLGEILDDLIAREPKCRQHKARGTAVE